MKIELWNRMVRGVMARKAEAALPDPADPGTLSPVQAKRLLIRLHDLEWQVRSLTDQCSTLRTTASVHDWSLEALWEAVSVTRTSTTPADPPNLGPSKKKTLN